MMIENIYNNINKEKKISKYVKYENWCHPYSDKEEQYVYYRRKKYYINYFFITFIIYHTEEERFDGER